MNLRDSGSVGHDDLVSAALLGLIEAIERYDPKRNYKFETYAVTRIRGAVVDTLRSLDWVPRSVRRRERVVRDAYARMDSVLGRPATDEEMASELGMDVDEFQETLVDIRQSSLISLEERMQGGGAESSTSLVDLIEGGEDPQALAEVAERKRKLAEAIERLPQKERIVIDLYYYEGLKLKEIGVTLGVTEARVSQIHTRALLRLQQQFVCC